MSDRDDEVRFNVKMPSRLRDDAKRNSERGELSEGVRDLFRRRAYGEAATSGNTELERMQAELRDVRNRIDDLRRERRQIDAEIESQETRETRLEERLSALEEKNDEFGTVIETLETMLKDGARIFPERVDDDLNSDEVIQELKNRNPDIPDMAYELANVHEQNDWRKNTDWDPETPDNAST